MSGDLQSQSREECKKFGDLVNSFMEDFEINKTKNVKVQMRLVCEVIMELDHVVMNPKGPDVIINEFERFQELLDETVDTMMSIYSDRSSKTLGRKKELHIFVRTQMYYIYAILEKFLARVQDGKPEPHYAYYKMKLDPTIKMLKEKTLGPTELFPYGLTLEELAK